MSEQYRFFDSVDGEDERYYTADEFAEYFRQFITSGIFNGGENLGVTTTGMNMSININEGYAWLEGYLYKIDTEPLSLILDAADPSLNRIDRIVIRLDKSLEKRYVRAFILKGTAAESPTPPSITRDENVYEVSLAQIRVTAGKSFISEAEITDERFDEKVCGIVNSLIKVDTHHLINKFESTWGNWFDGIRTQTFVPLENLEDGFIKTEEDVVHAIPNKSLQIEEGWPSTSYLSFSNTAMDNEGSIYINAFHSNGNLANNEITQVEANTGNTINDKNWVAFPFSVNEDSDIIKISLFMSSDENYRPTPSIIIYETNSEGLPAVDKEIASTSIPTAYPYNGAIVTKEIELNYTLEANKSYIAVIKDSYSFTWANLRAKNTLGTVKLYESKNSGSSWTAVERTPFLEINGIKREGSITITHPNEEQLKEFLLAKHLLVNVDFLNYIDSYYKVDILDLENNIIKEDIKKNQRLMDISSEEYKGIKTRITIYRAGLEKPKLRNYQYTWIKNISNFDGGQSIIPSDYIIFEFNNERTTKSTTPVQVFNTKTSLGGKYRLKGQIYTETTSYNAIVTAYENSINGRQIGRALTGSLTPWAFTIDLDAIPPNSNIVVALNGAHPSYAVFIKDTKICGKPGYQRNK